MTGDERKGGVGDSTGRGQRRLSVSVAVVREGAGSQSKRRGGGRFEGGWGLDALNARAAVVVPHLSGDPPTFLRRVEESAQQDARARRRRLRRERRLGDERASVLEEGEGGREDVRRAPVRARHPDGTRRWPVQGEAEHVVSGSTTP